MGDKIITCADCGEQFTFSESEQSFYAEKGFTEPRRCRTCRATRKTAREYAGSSGGSRTFDEPAPLPGSPRGYGGSSADRPSREYFTAVCSSCGNQARLPFRPSGAKPVYCSDCFRAQTGR